MILYVDRTFQGGWGLSEVVFFDLSGKPAGKIFQLDTVPERATDCCWFGIAR